MTAGLRIVTLDCSTASVTSSEFPTRNYELREMRLTCSSGSAHDDDSANLDSAIKFANDIADCHWQCLNLRRAEI